MIWGLPEIVPEIVLEIVSEIVFNPAIARPYLVFIIYTARARARHIFTPLPYRLSARPRIDPAPRLVIARHAARSVT